MLEEKSPTKWKESQNYDNMSNLWLPSGCYNSQVITEFMQWCERVTNDILWLDLNKNIAPFLKTNWIIVLHQILIISMVEIKHRWERLNTS